MAPAEIRAWLAQARYQQGIINAITRPAEGKPWKDYRPIFLTETRIRQGRDFYAENRSDLEKVAAQTGVPAEIIVVDHGRGNQLRANHRHLSRARCAVHARLLLSAAGRILSQRTDPPVQPGQGREARPGDAQGQLRRRDGLGPVHAVELPQFRPRRRWRRSPRSARLPEGCVRLDRQLFHRPRLADRNAGFRSGDQGCRRGGVRAGRFRRQVFPGRPRRARLSTARPGRAGAAGHLAHARGRRTAPSTGSATRISTSSPATTGRRCTRWRCSSLRRKSRPVREARPDEAAVAGVHRPARDRLRHHATPTDSSQRSACFATGRQAARRLRSTARQPMRADAGTSRQRLHARRPVRARRCRQRTGDGDRRQRRAGAGAARRAAFALRQSLAIHGARQELQGSRQRRRLQRTRRGLLVRRQVQRPRHVERRAVRHVPVLRRAQDLAPAQLRARDQSGQRPQPDRAGQ